MGVYDQMTQDSAAGHRLAHDAWIRALQATATLDESSTDTLPVALGRMPPEALDVLALLLARGPRSAMTAHRAH